MIIKIISFSFAVILLYGVGMLFAQVNPSSLKSNPQQTRGQRLFQPEDLFRIWRIGETKWSPDGGFSAIEVLRPGRTLLRW